MLGMIRKKKKKSCVQVHRITVSKERGQFHLRKTFTRQKRFRALVKKKKKNSISTAAAYTPWSLFVCMSQGIKHAMRTFEFDSAKDFYTSQRRRARPAEIEKKKKKKIPVAIRLFPSSFV